MKQNHSQTGFCLHLQVEATQLGPADRARLCLRTPAKASIRFVKPTHQKPPIRVNIHTVIEHILHRAQHSAVHAGSQTRDPQATPVTRKQKGRRPGMAGLQRVADGILTSRVRSQGSPNQYVISGGNFAQTFWASKTCSNRNQFLQAALCCMCEDQTIFQKAGRKRSE
jgi:hypothetical protein